MQAFQASSGILTAWFRTTDGDPPLTLYGFNSAPTGTTDREADIVFSRTGTGFDTVGIYTAWEYRASRGTATSFLQAVVQEILLLFHKY